MTKPDRSFRLSIVAACLFGAGVLVLPASAVAQPAGQDERIAAAAVLAFGRTATNAESERWRAQGALSIAELVERHRLALKDDAGVQRAVALKADHDAFGGGMPGADGLGLSGAGRTYADLVQERLKWLGDHQAEYGRVIERAYRAVLGRGPYPVEIDYWKRQPAITFALLSGCVENWAVRNQPGLMATTGVAAISVNSRYLATVRLSPAIAAEARAAIGLAPVGGRTPASALGRHVVAPGAAGIVSVGGVHLVAAGGPALEEAATAK